MSNATGNHVRASDKQGNLRHVTQVQPLIEHRHTETAFQQFNQYNQKGKRSW